MLDAKKDIMQFSGEPDKQSPNLTDITKITQAVGDQIVELLKKQNSLIEKSTNVNRKGFGSLKLIDHQSFAALVKTLPPLCYEKENEDWISHKTVEKETGMVLSYLKVQRSRGETVTHKGIRYGRDKDGRIWCKRADIEAEPKSRKIFYLKSSLSGGN